MKPDPMRLADRAWPLLRRVAGLHTSVYRLSGGRIGHRLPGAPAMLLLEHVGARSGRRRTTPLVYARDGERLVLVASKGGHPRHPAWYHNLRANPRTAVEVGSRRLEVLAREAREEEREHLWALAVATYGGFESYRRRTERRIPLVVLEPVSG